MWKVRMCKLVDSADGAQISLVSVSRERALNKGEGLLDSPVRRKISLRKRVSICPVHCLCQSHPSFLLCLCFSVKCPLMVSMYRHIVCACARDFGSWWVYEVLQQVLKFLKLWTPYCSQSAFSHTYKDWPVLISSSASRCAVIDTALRC